MSWLFLWLLKMIKYAIPDTVAILWGPPSPPLPHHKILHFQLRKLLDNCNIWNWMQAFCPFCTCFLLLSAISVCSKAIEKHGFFLLISYLSFCYVVQKPGNCWLQFYCIEANICEGCCTQWFWVLWEESCYKLHEDSLWNTEIQDLSWLKSVLCSIILIETLLGFCHNLHC